MSLLTIILITAVVLAVLIYFGLPRVLQTFGLHGHYEIPPYRIEGKRRSSPPARAHSVKAARRPAYLAPK